MSQLGDVVTAMWRRGIILSANKQKESAMIYFDHLLRTYISGKYTIWSAPLANEDLRSLTPPQMSLKANHSLT